MRKILNVVLALIVVNSLTACMVVPPYDAYGGPGVTVVAPYPVYRPYYGEPMRPHRFHHGGRGHW